MAEEQGGLARRERVDAQLRVGAQILPAMTILGAIADEYEHARRRRQALHDNVEQRLRLGVDPVEILEEQSHGLHPALGEDEALEGLQCALPSYRWLEGIPRGI